MEPSSLEPVSSRISSSSSIKNVLERCHSLEREIRKTKGMKPGRPRAITSTRNHIRLGWDSCESLILKRIQTDDDGDEVGCEDGEDENRRWYLIERKDRVLGWTRVYMGFKTETNVGPMAPGDYYEFRLKVRTKEAESDWSDTLFAVTKDDIIPVAQLHRAVENGPVTSLRKILGQRPGAVDVPNKYGRSSLRLAVHKNNTNFMGILLNHGADLDDPEPGSGRTPLMTAAIRGHLEAVQLILEKGSSWHVKDRNGLTALNYAVDNSNLPIVQLAIEEGADLSDKDQFGWSPLMRGVVLRSSMPVLAYLLDNGSDPNEFDDRRQTILMQAVLSGRPDVVQLLIDKGADVEARNLYGHSAYDMAKNSFNDAIVKMAHILGNESENGGNNGTTNTNSRGADPKDLRNPKRRS